MAFTAISLTYEKHSARIIAIGISPLSGPQMSLLTWAMSELEDEQWEQKNRSRPKRLRSSELRL